jgi:Sec-independent protein translocase protein TatA
LRARVREASGFAKAQSSAADELHSVRSQLENTLRAAGELVPHAADLDVDEHRAAAASIASILGTEPLMDKTREALGALKEQRDALKDAGEEAMREIADALRSVRADESADAGRLASLLSNVDAAAEEAASARSRQLAEASRVLVPVREELDKQAGTSTASAVFRLAQHVDDLVVTLRKRYATNAVRAEYAAALKDVDKAKLAVFNEKFSGMSDEISRWWKLLRPDEPVAFHRAAPRGTGRRFVAMEAKLSSAGREEIRDALGVLSDSQLNALGVSAFLARAVLQQTRLIVLDDPLQSGDDEHRDTFIDQVVPELLDAGLQVVLTTYDSQFKRLLTNAQQLDGFTVTLDEPTAGTVVVKGTDTAEALLREAKSFLKDTASLRDTGAGRLRIAAERVAKEILVAKRTAAGERASLADYAKQSLEKLVPQLLQHLTDERERGRWKNVSPRLSPGAHDDEPPPKNTLQVVYQHLLESHREHVRDATT